MHPNRQFLAHFVLYTSFCLHVLFRVPRPLHSHQGCEGTVNWGILGYVGCEDAVACDRKGGGVQTSDICKHLQEKEGCRDFLMQQERAEGPWYPS